MISWPDGSSGSEYIVTSSGSYTLMQSNICGTATDTIEINFWQSPLAFSLGTDLTLCAGDTVIIEAPITTDVLTWQDGSHNDMFAISEANLYGLTITNVCGEVYDGINVTMDSNIPVVDFEIMTICPGQTIHLDATQSFVAEYIWNTGSMQESISIQVPGTYAVTIVTDCYIVENSILIEVSDDCKPITQFFIPTIFSPNGDGLNDEFVVQFNASAEIVSVTGFIYDRWGNVIFESALLPFRWNGTFGDIPMNPGSYVYRFEIMYFNGLNVVSEKLTGDITLIR